MAVELFMPVKTARCLSDAVLVGFSGGKDSVVTLDLCCRYFKRVVAYHLHLVPGLSFQEAMLAWAERRYGIEVLRLPHPMLGEWLRYGVFVKEHGDEIPAVSFNDVYRYLRVTTDLWWIAGGERIADSIVRRAMMKRSGSIDAKRGRIYPVAHFRKADVLAYIRHHKLKLAPEYRVLGHSFSSLDPDEVRLVRQHYPADFARIQRIFPFVEAACVRSEIRQRARDQAPAVRGGADAAQRDPGGDVQPADDHRAEPEETAQEDQRGGLARAGGGEPADRDAGKRPQAAGHS